jgi:hypothetical protein
MKAEPWPLTPITEETFERQGWEMVVEKEEEGDYNESQEYYYWVLPLPKDNPDENAPVFISSCNDDYSELGIKKGEYFVEIQDMFGLGICTSEEELEILYRGLTKTEIEK